MNVGNDKRFEDSSQSNRPPYARDDVLDTFELNSLNSSGNATSTVSKTSVFSGVNKETISSLKQLYECSITGRELKKALAEYKSTSLLATMFPEYCGSESIRKLKQFADNIGNEKVLKGARIIDFLSDNRRKYLKTHAEEKIKTPPNNGTEKVLQSIFATMQNSKKYAEYNISELPQEKEFYAGKINGRELETLLSKYKSTSSIRVFSEYCATQSIRNLRGLADDINSIKWVSGSEIVNYLDSDGKNYLNRYFENEKAEPHNGTERVLKSIFDMMRGVSPDKTQKTAVVEEQEATFVGQNIRV